MNGRGTHPVGSDTDLPGSGGLEAAPATAAPVDLAIVGRGLVGETLALVLAGRGLSVALVGPRPAPQAAPRALALGRATITMLETLGLWRDLKGAAQPMARIVVTDGRPGGDELSLLEFSGAPGGQANAEVIEEHLVSDVLDAAIAGQTRIRRAKSIVAGTTLQPGWRSLALADGGTLDARLVVAADGARSVLRRLAGIKTVRWDYGQSAIVATLAHDRDHLGLAVERFYPAGPFAILPLSGRRSSLVWTEAAARAGALAGTDEADFAAELALRWDEGRGAVTSIGRRATFPLAFHVARSFIAPRLALVGDAAHQVHPLAGQGVNLGLRDVAALAETVIDGCRLGLDPGSGEGLERYQRWRRFDAVGAAFAFDGLNRLFANDRDGLRALRDLGLGMVERIAPVKRLLMREAAGQTGTLPRLMAGEAL